MGLTGTRAIDAQVAFSMQADDGSGAPLSAPAPAASPFAVARSIAGATSPTAELRAWEQKLVASAPPLAVGTGGASMLSVPTVGSTLGVRVPDLATDPCNQYTAVSSTVAFVGDKVVVAGPVPSGPVLTAVLNSAAFADLLADLGTLFGGTIVDRVAAYLGTGADLDDDGHLTVVLTTAFNDLGIPAFSTAVDLTPQSTCPASDEELIVYVAIPSLDYTDVLQASTIIDALTDALDGSPPLLTRELAHLVRTSARLAGGLVQPLPTWLTEGQAELIVEVVGRTVRGDAPGMDYGSAVVNAGTTTGLYYAPRFDQLAHLFGWDGGTGKIAGAPEQCSLFGFGGLSNPCQPAHAPGGAWAFLRYLTDRIAPGAAGGEEELHQALAMATGGSDLETILETYTEAGLDELLVAWAMTLYVDGRLTPQQAPELQVTSWNLADIYGAMPAYKQLTPDVVDFEAFSMAGSVAGGGTAYLRIETAGAHGPLAIDVRDPLGNPLSDDIRPRLWVVRLQ